MLRERSLSCMDGAMEGLHAGRGRSLRHAISTRTQSMLETFPARGIAAL